MKRILATFSLLTSLFFCSPAPANELIMPSGDFSEMKKTGVAIVTEVVNPITLKLKDGRFILLAGLDYPDLDYYEPGDLSVTAQKILDDFLRGQRVTIYQTPSTEQGRLNRINHHIAHLVRTNNDVWVQGLLISLGVARMRTSQLNPEMTKQMLILEDAARVRKSGLWNMDEFKILNPQQVKKFIGTYQIVEGRIHSASMLKNRLYLNFGRNWRDDFSVSISAFDLKKFTKKRIDPQNWNGKLIRVRGWVESKNGPYMEIDHPERFEALFERQDEKKLNNTKKSEEMVRGSSLPHKPSLDLNREKRPRNTDRGSALPVFND